MQFSLKYSYEELRHDQNAMDKILEDIKSRKGFYHSIELTKETGLVVISRANNNDSVVIEAYTEIDDYPHIVLDAEWDLFKSETIGSEEADAISAKLCEEGVPTEFKGFVSSYYISDVETLLKHIKQAEKIADEHEKESWDKIREAVKSFVENKEKKGVEDKEKKEEASGNTKTFKETLDELAIEWANNPSEDVVDFVDSLYDRGYFLHLNPYDVIHEHMRNTIGYFNIKNMKFLEAREQILSVIMECVDWCHVTKGMNGDELLSFQNFSDN